MYLFCSFMIIIFYLRIFVIKFFSSKLFLLSVVAVLFPFVGIHIWFILSYLLIFKYGRRNCHPLLVGVQKYSCTKKTV